jgi:cation diffusion facilitator family transporter
MTPEEKKQEVKVVTLVGGVIDIILSAIKIIIGAAFHSNALIVDGLHSLSDLFTDFFVLWVAKYSHDAPDKEHPYGHGRFETLGTVILGVILISTALVLAYENVVRLFIGDIHTIPGWPTLVGAGLSVVLKEWVFRFTLKVGKKVDSPMVVANAWHSRSDALSSVAVLLGIGFAMLGLPWMDTVMAIVVSIMIGKVGWDFLWSSVKELLVTSLEPDFIEEVRAEIMLIDGVKSMHNLRSRRMGEMAILDVNIEVARFVTASEGHEISTYVQKNLVKKFKSINDVTVHTDVEDDRIDGQEFSMEKRELLPLRSEVKETLLKLIDIPDYLYMDLHYDNKITIDFVFEEKALENISKHDLLHTINTKCSDIVWLEKIQILIRL